MQQLERDVGVTIALPPGGLSAVLDQIKARIDSDAASAAAASVSMAPTPAGQRPFADG
jgi:non-specific serine/threonine protein kinase